MDPSIRLRGLLSAALIFSISPALAQSIDPETGLPSTEEGIVEDLIGKAAKNNNGNGNGDGNGNQSCQILVVNSGNLGSGLENNTLSSKIYGGKSGSAQIVTTNGSYSLSIDPPLGFSASPVGGNQNVTMNASYSGQGVTNFSETPGTIDIRLKRGLTVVDTHLTAKKSDGQPFPAGFYSAEVTLRCE